MKCSNLHGNGHVAAICSSQFSPLLLLFEFFIHFAYSHNKILVVNDNGIQIHKCETTKRGEMDMNDNPICKFDC